MTSSPPRHRLALGVDPGLTNTAYALIRQRSNGELSLLASQVIHLSRDHQQGMADAASLCRDFAEDIGPGLAVAAVEDQRCIMKKNWRVFAMGTALNAGLLVAFGRRIEQDPGLCVVSLSHTKWKGLLGIPCRGDHKLNKSLAVALAETTFGAHFDTDHEADAALIALAALKDLPWDPALPPV